MDSSSSSSSARPFDWDGYEWSEEARGRKGSLLQDIMARFASMPGTIPMHGGLPPADAFPFSALSFALAPPAAGGGGVAVGGGGNGNGNGNATPRSSASSEEAAVVEATIITNGVNGVKAASTATPSPDHHAPKDLNNANERNAPAVAVVASTTAVPPAPRNNPKKCRCNAASYASSSTTTTLTIDNPLTVAAAQQYNIGNYGQAGLRAWAARATAELQRPKAIFGSELLPSSSATPQQQQPQPGPPRAAVERSLFKGGRDLVVTAGSTAALDAALRALLSRGDSLLAEEFTYSHALEALMAPHGYKLIPVRMDRGLGLDPVALDAAARAEKDRTGRAPKVLYTIPVGQNPTGCVASMERLEQIYSVARKWGMVIIEDDAYCWLRLHADDEGGGGGAAGLSNGADNTNNAPLLPRPGLLSLDADGRVLRLDTFAKLLAPGLRLGWATGPAKLVRVVAEATMAATVGPPALSQVVALGLLQRWGCCCCVFDEDGEEESQLPSSIGPGFRQYLAALQRRYAVQGDLAARCASEHLQGVAEFESPRAGMFLWVRLLPLEVGEGDFVVVDGDRVVRRAGDLGVAVVPGRIFAVESYARGGGDEAQQPPKPCPFLRVSFVNTPASLVDEGLKRLRRAVDEERAEMMMMALTRAA